MLSPSWSTLCCVLLCPVVPAQALQDYCKLAPDGYSILTTPVYRCFPSDCIEDYTRVDREEMGSTVEQYIAM